MQKHHLELSPNQIQKLLRGHAVQLTHASLEKNKHHLLLEESNHKKVMKAKKAARGVRIALSSAEREHNAEGLRDFLQKVGKFYKDKIKPIAAPAVKNLVTQGKDYLVKAAEVAVPVLAPEIESLNQRYGNKAVDALGQVTGAYGVHIHHHHHFHKDGEFGGSFRAI